MVWLRRYLSAVRRAPAAPLLLALAPSLWAAAPLCWKTPLSFDHPSHIFKAWHFWTEMLGRGRIRGWSHFWAFGFPSNELYPSGSDVWVALFRAASLGQLSWTRTYALAFAGFLLFKALAVYLFTKAYFRVEVAVLAAWIATMDPGAMLQGGWHWHTTFGVWPVSLSMSMVLLAFVSLERVLQFGRTRGVFWAGIWVGAALLTHPVAMVAFAVTAPLFLCDAILRPNRSLSGVTRSILALSCGSGLAAFHFVPIFTRGDEIMDLGWLDYSLSDVLSRFLRLSTFDNVWAPIHALSIFGAVLMVSRRRRGALFFVASAALLVLLSSDTLVRTLHLERAFPGLIKIEFNRMLLVAKLFWFPLAAYGLADALHDAVVACLRLEKSTRWLVCAGGVLLGAAVILPGWPKFYQAQIEKRIQGERGTPYWSDLQDFLAWSRELKAHDREFYRIAYHFYFGNHLAMLAPVFNQTPLYQVGRSSSQIFNRFPMTDEPEVLQALGVKYVLSSDELYAPDLALQRRFGALWLYRLTTYRPEPFTLMGDGHAELLELEPERIRIRLTGTTAGSRLKINVANSARWQATLAGALTPIATVPVYGVEYPFLIEVPARDGELVLAYVYRPANWIGLLVTLLALPALMAVLWVERRSQPLARSLRWLTQAMRAKPWLFLAALAGFVGVVAVKTRSRSALLPAASIFHRLDGHNLVLGGQPCVKSHDLDFACGLYPIRADAVSGLWGVHSCMTAPDVGPLRIAARMRLGSFLWGSYDPAATGVGSLRMTVDGQNLGAIDTRPAALWQQFIQFDTREFRNRDADVEFLLTGAGLHCFDFRIVP